MALFKRPSTHLADDGLALGLGLVAVRLAHGARVPDGGQLIVFDAGGRARRSAAAKVACADGETAFAFHPGPYRVDLTPFAAAPELGLRLHIVVDAADPRVTQQRFDLFLFSEVAGRLTLRDLAGSLQAALRLELGQGAMDLPPCTSPDEWNLFRAGLNQLLYTRYGVTVDDCLPVDLAESIDFAAVLEQRARVQLAGTAPPAAPVAPPPALAPAAPAPPHTTPALLQASDAQAARRLFLELPAVTSGLRLLALPPGQQLFQAHQRLLQRLDLATLSIGTMPSLAWAAPDRRLDARQQARRVGAIGSALAALDEAWALLARFRLAAPAQLPPLLDEAERIVANLELGLELRRAAHLDPTDAPHPPAARLAPLAGNALAPESRREPS